MTQGQYHNVGETAELIGIDRELINDYVKLGVIPPPARTPIGLAYRHDQIPQFSAAIRAWQRGTTPRRVMI